MLCPICDANTRPLGAPLGGSKKLGLRACGACGHRFGVPERFDAHTAYDDMSYAGFRPDPQFEAKAESVLRAHVLPRVPVGARLLDVGCGNGTVLRVGERLGFAARGVDVSQAAVDHCRRQQLDAEVADFPTHDFGTEPFGVVTFWDVLEHLASPRAFIDRAARLLQPGGLLVAKVPGHELLSVLVGAWVPPLAGAVLQVPHHLQLFTRRSIQELVRREFEPLLVVDPGPMRTVSAGGALRRRLARKIVRTIHDLSGDHGLLIVARKRATESLADSAEQPRAI